MKPNGRYNLVMELLETPASNPNEKDCKPITYWDVIGFIVKVIVLIVLLWD